MGSCDCCNSQNLSLQCSLETSEMSFVYFAAHWSLSLSETLLYIHLHLHLYFHTFQWFRVHSVMAEHETWLSLTLSFWPYNLTCLPTLNVYIFINVIVIPYFITSAQQSGTSTDILKNFILSLEVILNCHKNTKSNLSSIHKLRNITY